MCIRKWYPEKVGHSGWMWSRWLERSEWRRQGIVGGKRKLGSVAGKDGIYLGRGDGLDNLGHRKRSGTSDGGRVTQGLLSQIKVFRIYSHSIGRTWRFSSGKGVVSLVGGHSALVSKWHRIEIIMYLETYLFYELLFQFLKTVCVCGHHVKHISYCELLSEKFENHCY